MNKYIIEILKVQSSVILPGLGALMVASTKTGKVVFNAHLKFNDGSLAKFIAEKEGVDKQEAENKVAKWIREIEAELGKGNKFEIFEFGHFFTNKDGAVDFEMAGGTKIEVEEKPKVTPAKAESKKEEPKKETPKKEEPKKVEPKKETKPAATKKEETKVAPKKEDVKPKNTLTPKSESKKEEDKKASPSTPPKKVEETKAAVDKKATERKKDSTPKIPVAGASAGESKQEKNTFVPKKDAKAEPKKDEPKKDDKAATVIAGAEAATQADIKEKYKKSNSKTNKKTEKPKKEKKEKGEKKKKSRVGLWILLIILAGGVTAGYFYRNEIEDFLFTGVGDDGHGEDDTHGDEVATGDDHADLAMMESDTTANGEEGMIDENAEESSEEMTEEVGEETTEEVQEEVVEEVVEETPVTTNNSSPGGSYHLIGNAFSDKSNAENYVSMMSGKGYSAQILGRFDNLYLVAIKSFDSRSAANSGLSGVSADAPDAWVFKYAK